MPLYEYNCQSCGQTTEFLEKSDSRANHSCEHCGGKRMRKVFSPFAARTASPSHSHSAGGPSACSACSSAACATCRR